LRPSQQNQISASPPQSFQSQKDQTEAEPLQARSQAEQDQDQAERYPIEQALRNQAATWGDEPYTKAHKLLYVRSASERSFALKCILVNKERASKFILKLHSALDRMFCPE
jgi:hypothetical protein